MADERVEVEKKKQRPVRVVEKPRFSRTEKLGITLVLLIGSVLAYSYFADIPIRELFRLGRGEDVMSTPIGTVISVEGQVMRKRAKEMSFRALTESALVYPNDTVMTGPDGLCVIVLKNGRTIRITPNSLVKLAYGAELSADGISVDVLRGSLGDDAGRAVPMQGTPSGPVGMGGPAAVTPLVILGTTPAEATSYRFTADEFARRRKRIAVAAKINRKAAVKFELIYIDPLAAKRVRVAETSPEFSKELEGSVTFEFDHPGRYEWNILDEKGKVAATTVLTLKPEVQVISALPAGDSNDRLSGDASVKTYPGPLLRWTPHDGTGAYRIRISAPGAKTPKVYESLTAEVRVRPEDASIDRPLHYSVEKELPGGFLAMSGPLTFQFTFVAPELVTPAQDKHLDPEALATAGDLVFLTWSKTNFTSSYELQLNTKPTFSSPLLTRAVKDNVFSLRTPAPGRYFWRVRSRVQNVWTPFSEPRSFTVDSQSQ